MHFQMGIVKVEVKVPALVQALEQFKENRRRALEALSVEIRSGKTTSVIFCDDP